MSIYPTTRKQAKQEGSKFYAPGSVCKYGHISIRYTSHGTCKECLDSKVYVYDSEEAIAKRRYADAKCCAKNRNIDWLFTFETWYKWWLDTGHYHERGCKRGQYVMSRYKDEGPYSIENVFCQTQEANAREGHLGKKEKDTSKFKRGKDPEEVRLKKKAAGERRRGIKLSPESIAKRTATRRLNNNGNY